MNWSKIIISVLLGCIVLGIIIWACVSQTRTPAPVEYMSFQPIPSDGTTLIQYRNADSKSWRYWVEKLNTFLSPYFQPLPAAIPYYRRCEQGVPPEAGSNQLCDIDVREWGTCNKDSMFNYHRGEPCVFLVFNKILNWSPEYYTVSTIPNSMPSFLKVYINETESKYGSDSPKLKLVWVSCEGDTNADKEMLGNVTYQPTFGFDGRYFPVVNEESYLNPVVAVHFHRLRSGIVLNVICKAWARNLNHEKGEGVVHFEFLLD